MDVADAARELAIPLEAKKDGLQQRQDGSWTLKLRIHPQDSMELIAKAAMGTRYQIVLVELNDDETSKQRKSWNDLTPATQAAIRCGEPEFWAFLNVHSKEEAENEVRKRCEVQSRTEFSTDEKAAAKWETLDSDYRMYQRGIR